MPKFSWKTFLKELGLTLLPVVVDRVLPAIAEKLQPNEINGTTAGDIPIVERRENAGRRSTDTLETFVRVPRG